MAGTIRNRRGNAVDPNKEDHQGRVSPTVELELNWDLARVLIGWETVDIWDILDCLMSGV